MIIKINNDYNYLFTFQSTQGALYASYLCSFSNVNSTVPTHKYINIASA